MESYFSEDDSPIPHVLEPAFDSAETTSIRETQLSLAQADPHGDICSRVEVSSFFEAMQADQSLTSSVGISHEDRKRVPLHLKTLQNQTDHDHQMCSTPQNLIRPLSRALSELSLTSILTTTSSTRSQLLKGSNIKAAFSPKSRKRIIDSTKFVGSNKNSEPIFYNALLTSCSERCSVVDFSRSVIRSQQRNRMIDSLELGDRVLIEFKGGLVLEDGSSIAILEGTVLTTSSGLKQVTVLEHEAVHFSLRGGAMAVNVFLVNRLFYEKKFHQLAITGLTELRKECTLRVVQGPPQSAKLSHIFNRIRESIPTNRRLLIIGKQVRERVSLPSYCTFLNLCNLRLSKERLFDTEEQAENARILRGCHFEYRDQIQKLERQLGSSCTDYCAKMTHIDHKTLRMQDIQETVLKLEALKDLLSETDRNLAIEAFPDVTIIYGTVEDVSNNHSLLTHLAPSVSVVLDAESLSRAQLGAIFRVRKGHVYLACDTPFFWDAVLEWKDKDTSHFLRRSREPVSSELIRNLESFIDTDKVDFHFFSSRDVILNKGLAVLQACFKYDFPKVVTKAQNPNNVVLIRHSLKDEAAVRFELNFIADLRRFFIMRGDHDHFTCCIGAGGALQEAQTGFLNRVKSPANGKGLLRKHTQTLVSLHNLTAATLPELYKILKFTTREFFMVGNIAVLKKTDEHVSRFLSNLLSAGLVRRNIVFTCPKHHCDVLLGEGKENGLQSGCQETCNKPLSCGHLCPQKCHFHDDQTFDETWAPCRERCNVILPCKHRCPYTCGQPCISRCQEKVQILLGCGHHAVAECCERDSSEIPCPKPKCPKNSPGSVRSHSFFSRMRHPF